jgi:hypothetical protein
VVAPVNVKTLKRTTIQCPSLFVLFSRLREGTFLRFFCGFGYFKFLSLALKKRENIFNLFFMFAELLSRVGVSKPALRGPRAEIPPEEQQYSG